MKVPLLDLTRLAPDTRATLQETFTRVLDSGHFILGAEVEAFERECAAYLGARHALAVSSGTDALLMALLALDIGPGDEVICPSYTFFATAGTIWRTGARPVFVDSAACCYNLDTSAIAPAITSRTKALLPVHLFGQSADLAPILELARHHDLAVIEDAAQAIGARYAGRAAGTLGTVGCYSFFPTKNLGAMGDAGLLVTADDALAEKLRMARTHGSKVKYHHEFVGGNFRIDALQAALLRVKLPLLESAHAARRKNAARYHQLFLESGLAAFPTETCLCQRETFSQASDAPLLLPFACQESHIYNQFVVRVSGAGQRDALRAVLTGQGIGTEIYYPIPLHRQPCFAALPALHLPNADRFAAETLALPIFPELREAEIDYVADTIIRFLRASSLTFARKPL